MGLEAEAVLQGKTLKKLASDLILGSISEKALQFVQQSSKSLLEEEGGIHDKKEDASDTYCPRISENIQAIQKIKELWSRDPRPSQREIARIIDYPASSTKYQIKNMLERGELKG
ncbi:MAG TPA: winged helix-turn-helix transcriptional regulator [Methanothrix sp.]|nr:winged helix-turn-helix transcriptional regulator [Methanothrix sp.]